MRDTSSLMLILNIAISVSFTILASVASSSSTCHPTTVTGPSQSATQTQSASQQPKENIPESEKCEDFSQSDNLGNRLAKHFPLLRIMQLQV